MTFRLGRVLTCSPEDRNILVSELIGHLWFDAGFFWRCTSVVIEGDRLHAMYE